MKVTDRIKSDEPASLRLDGKVAFVTGGNKGIGKGIALAMAAAGADVAITGRDAASAEGVLSQLKRFGTKCEFIAGDIRDEAFVDGAVDQVVAKLGRIDSLVNNAGIGPEKPAMDITREDWRDMQLVNLEAPFRLSQAAAKHFFKQGGGSIINITSIRGQQAAIEEAHYIAAKHGLNGLTKALAYEWAEQGVRVNAIAPGLILTEMTRHWQEDGTVEDKLLRYPIRRPGYPRDIGGLAVFLASEAADFIHGQIIPVDGARTVG